MIGAGLGGLVSIAGGLVAYAAVTGHDRLMFPETPARPVAISQDPAVIERGRYLVHGPAHCAMCHSTSNREKPEEVRSTPLRGGLSFAMGPLGTRYAANLTPDLETGIGAMSDEHLARVLQTGVMHDGELSFFMRYAAGRLSDEDTGAVMSYLRSLEPVKHKVPTGHWDLFGKVLITYVLSVGPDTRPAPEHVAASDEPSIERGRYLADHVMLCTTCHSEVEKTTFEPVGPKAGGSLPDPSHGSDSDMEYVAPNLTSHPTGRTGVMTEDAFVARLQAGRVFASSIMPWECFADTRESDLRSVYRYLRSLPPVDNDTGPSYRKAGWEPGDE